MDKLEFLVTELKKENFNRYNLSGIKGFDLFRALVNQRPPSPISDEFIKVQDELLQEMLQTKAITSMGDLQNMNEAKELNSIETGIYLWQGDITTLKVDAIVNAGNSGMTGCYYPLHKCIDNAIHTFSGIQLRIKCDEIMKQQGYPEPTGIAKITSGYNLPSKYVIHTVGPIVHGALTEKDCNELENCYKSCLDIAVENNVKSIAFCCISTGEFHFPNEKAGEIAVKVVKEYLKNHKMDIIFNVFKDTDYDIYKKLLV